jgi:hypothetical protein
VKKTEEEANWKTELHIPADHFWLCTIDPRKAPPQNFQGQLGTCKFAASFK